MTELSDDEQETDADEFFFKLEEVSSVQATGKQLCTSLEFADLNARYKTKLDCQLGTGATCNVLTHRDLSVIGQTGHPALQASKMKLPLFNGAVMKAVGEVALNVQKVGQSPHVLKFQVIEGDSKPLLSAETCETLELLKINCNPTPQVNSIYENQTNLTKEKILQDYKDVFESLGNIGKASLTVDPEVTPVHHAPRRIAVTLHKDVKAKYGKAESAVKIVKGLFKKANRENKDPWLSLLNYRNTPTTANADQPCTMSYVEKTKTKNPSSHSNLPAVL